ncbi:MAG: hypothetical protein AAFS07_03005 [Pseudomonadota bacterium]
MAPIDRTAPPRETKADIEAAAVPTGKPLLVVDADEVLLEFAGHIARWLTAVGYEMRLTRYELEGAIFPLGEPHPVDFSAAVELIRAFFEEECAHQSALDGAVEAIGRLSREATVVVLTNIPRTNRAARVRNLEGLGITAPVIANVGGKGRALRMLAAKAAAPVIFLDDSPSQIASAARHAEGVHRVHFMGSPFIRPVLQPAEEADQLAHDWTGAEAMIRRELGL